MPTTAHRLVRRPRSRGGIEASDETAVIRVLWNYALRLADNNGVRIMDMGDTEDGSTFIDFDISPIAPD